MTERKLKITFFDWYTENKIEKEFKILSTATDSQLVAFAWQVARLFDDKDLESIKKIVSTELDPYDY
ncbi:MAG: hypothetical protein IJ728_10810 [Selenomonadaceae bacterium]|nr:hypothetical protein [Selenomonadaceae bacterium]